MAYHIAGSELSLQHMLSGNQIPQPKLGFRMLLGDLAFMD